MLFIMIEQKISFITYNYFSNAVTKFVSDQIKTITHNSDVNSYKYDRVKVINLFSSYLK